MIDALEGEGFRLRRASADDLEFMVVLASHEDVEPFMAAVSAREPDTLREEIRQSEAEPQYHGRFVVEVDGARAGVMAFEVSNRRSRIANLRSLMLLPEFRGRGIADAAARRSSGTCSSISTTTACSSSATASTSVRSVMRSAWASCTRE